MGTEKSNKAAGLFQRIMLFFFLIGLPLGSYIYLNAGYQYQKGLMSNLTKERMMPNLNDWALLSGIEPDSLMGSMQLVSFLSTKKENAIQEFSQVFKKLHEQFDAPANLDFVILTAGKDSSWVHQLLEKEEIEDEEQIRVYTADDHTFEQTANNYGFTAEQLSQYPEIPFLAMVDDSLYVRVIYQLNSEADIKKLVEQVAVMLPERNKPKARVKRETEK